MRAALLDRNSDVSVTDLPEPSLGDKDVLIRVGACGICASDLHVSELKTGDLPYPLVPGHEVAGTVILTGQAVRNVRPGEHVVVQPTITCGACRLCQRGHPNLCLDAQVIGLHRPGGFAQFLAVPSSHAYSSSSLADDVAACTEPLACTLHGLRRLAPRPADRTLVFGAGAMGLFFLQLVRQQSSGPITVVDMQPQRLEVARELGADQVIEADGSRGESGWQQQAHTFDCVVDATGVPTVIEAAFSCLVPGGKLLLLGSPPTAAIVAVSPRQIQRQDATVVGS